MLQAFHCEVDLHNSTYNPAPYINGYRFKGYLMHHKHGRGHIPNHIPNGESVHLKKVRPLNTSRRVRQAL